jgi:GNAT superfamily N-acetyltransferase
MTEPGSSGTGASAPAAAVDWSVRPAAGGDVAAIAAAVEELLVELGGGRPSREELESEAQVGLDDPAIGAIFVAEAGGEIVGVLSASWQRGLHVPGLYATIQDLWVHRDWRSRAIGAALVEALAGLCRERGVVRIEVGLPRETFAAIEATEAFYARNGFSPLGPRMRRLLS